MTSAAPPRVLGIIAVPRTGSNRLAGTLAASDRFDVVWEIFHPSGRAGLKPVAPELCRLSGIDPSDPSGDAADRRLADWARSNPGKVIDRLAEVQDPGRCVVFKLFPDHIEDAEQLQALFQRKDIAFVVLKRRPIDCYISLLKAQQLGEWSGVDTTDIALDLTIHGYLKKWAQWNHWYWRCLDMVEANGRPFVEMTYEEDLAGSVDHVASQTSEKLSALGLGVSRLPVPDDRFTKQDRESDYRRKVANWTDFFACLGTLGLDDASLSADGLGSLLRSQRRGSDRTADSGEERNFAPDPRLISFNSFSQFVLDASGEVRVGCGGGKLAPGKPLRFEVETPIALGHAPANDQALVSCLMVTRDRPQQCRLAIGCFRRQTWHQREVVIIDTSEDDELARWVESLNDPRIRFIFMPGCMDCLGDLRNLAVEAARGEFVAQWDDDDLSHPARLQAQMAFMSASGAPVGMLQRELVWMPQSYRLSVARRRTHENTLICKKAIMPAYPARARLEDTPLVEGLARNQAVALLDQPDLYVYVAHGTNTWDDDHMEEIWRASTDRFQVHSYDRMISQLSRCYPIREYQQLLAARGTLPAGRQRLLLHP